MEILGFSSQRITHRLSRKVAMKHKCTESREREMSLMWVCSCGEQTTAEEQFAEDEQVEIEKKLLITTEALEKIATAGTYWGETMRQYAVDALNDVNQL